MTAPELVFLHIPKTAGTSVQDALRRYYGEQAVFWFGLDCPAGLRRYPRKRIGERQLIGGHKPLHFYPTSIDPLYCAVLRDPVARVISLFGYYARPELARDEREREVRALHLRVLRDKGLDPDSMLRSIRQCRAFRREITNFQCKYLSRGLRTLSAVRKTLAGRDVVIGTVERFDEFYRYLGELLEWPQEAPGLNNRSQDDYAAQYLQDKELIALIRELNTEDEKLLRFIETEHQGLWIDIKQEQRRTARLRGLPLIPWLRSGEGWNWERAGAQLWQDASAQALPWPLASVLVVDEPALVYVPIPGPCDSWVQRLMLGLSKINHQEAVVELGMGRVLQRFNTGLLLRDRGPEQCRELLADVNYRKFAVINEPYTRLIDVYCEYFVARRMALSTWPRLYALVGRAQGCDQPDLAAGISFRQFVAAALVGPAEKAHALWRPQHLYLDGAVGCDTLYTPETLVNWYAALMDSHAAARISALPSPPDSAQVSPGYEGAGGEYADIPAGQLPADGVARREALLDANLCKRIQEYYKRDFELYATASGNTGEVAGK